MAEGVSHSPLPKSLITPLISSQCSWSLTSYKAFKLTLSQPFTRKLARLRRMCGGGQ